MVLEKIAYTAHAVANGGRDGESKTEQDGGNHPLSVKLTPPKEMHGNGEGNNPEQLFAAGYAACFLGAMKHVASQDASMPKPGTDTRIHSSVAIGPRDDKAGFGLAVTLELEMPGVDKAQAKVLMDKAHIVCPYSNATKGNIEVKLSIR